MKRRMLEMKKRMERIHEIISFLNGVGKFPNVGVIAIIKAMTGIVGSTNRTHFKKKLSGKNNSIKDRSKKVGEKMSRGSPTENTSSLQVPKHSG